ncbi:hypothetical protein NKR19_g4266 [Coniochaeta hoffmannii]|uniref:Uncharacterized protein n=1 Tax=Coniochaeta hoffmannii TaxID=91930 RepID=A0AA38SAD8_9PEZI|nr:hypothetical protein NKR19_g4266 [Coniochaeta hoffmannii]
MPSTQTSTPKVQTNLDGYCVVIAQALDETNMSGSSLASRCGLQPTATTKPQQASFGPLSNCGSETQTMVHCTLSGPSTAAQLRCIFHGPHLHFFSTVNRQHHYRHSSTPTTTLFSLSPSSAFSASPTLLVFQQPEPGFERDWPVPDDDVHYC